MKNCNCCDKKSVNGASDLEIIVRFVDYDGNAISVPEYDFELSYFVFKEKQVTASRIDGTLHNCVIDGDELHIFLDAPALGQGTLFERVCLHIPDDNFPDGFRDVVDEAATQYRFSDTACPLSAPVEEPSKLTMVVRAAVFTAFTYLAAEDGLLLCTENDKLIIIQ